MRTAIKNIAITISAIAATLAICLGIMAWSEPSATPPGDNVSAPINTSSTQQTKAGPLGIKINDLGYWISQVGQSLAFFNSDASGNPKDAQMVIGQDGNVGIGTEVPDKKLVVGGAAQAAQFCLNGKCCSTWEECRASNGHWIKHDGLDDPSNIVSGIASSSDGSRLAVIDKSGNVYISADFGATWNKKHIMDAISALTPIPIVSSSDGSHLAAVDGTYKKIFTSVDFGATWVERAVPADYSVFNRIRIGNTCYYNDGSSFLCGHPWNFVSPYENGNSMAMSANGKKMVFILQRTYNSGTIIMIPPGEQTIDFTELFVVDDFESAVWNWSRRGPNVALYGYIAAVTFMQNSDTKLTVATLRSDYPASNTYKTRGIISTSADLGATWKSSTAPDIGWRTVKSSPGGKYLTAGTPTAIVSMLGNDNELYFSADLGATWKSFSSFSIGRLGTIADNGKAVVVNRNLVSSTDFGVTWWGEPSPTSFPATSIIISENGGFIAAVSGGYFWSNF